MSRDYSPVSGINVLVASSRSSIKVTFDTYGHLFPGRGKEASDRYEKAMRDAREKSKADVRKTFAIEGEEKGASDATN